jgi:hypothetical protein
MQKILLVINAQKADTEAMGYHHFTGPHHSAEKPTNTVFSA